MNYFPKGGRCAACALVLADCSKLPFQQMPVHRTDGTDAVVICTEFRRQPESQRAK
ncbi:hypothetical protein D3C81_2285720 [compost metagenome]